MCYLENNSILNPFQYGFRKRKSTTLAVNHFINNCFAALENRFFVLGIFLDFSKAFDTIDHGILTQKLEHYGIRDKELKWFKNYLDQRTQRVKLDDVLSDEQDLTCGVPQGSVLGPTLFIIYTNELPFLFTDTQIEPILYADDTNLFYKFRNFTKTDNQLINMFLEKLRLWTIRNKLSLNARKTNVLIFSSPHAQTKPHDILFNFQIGNENINKIASEVKFLGVKLNSSLNWSSHVTLVQNKLRSKIQAFLKISKLLEKTTLIKIYYAFIHPHITYCLDSYGNAPKYLTDKILILQKKFIRVIHGANHKVHTKPLFSNTKILTITQLFKFRLLCLAHKLYYDITRKEFKNPKYNTRFSLYSLPIKRTSNKYGDKITIQNASMLWNEIPTDIRAEVDFANFKAALRDHLVGF